MPLLIDHLERRLGQLTSGWKGAPREGLPAVNVACFTGGVFSETTGYATVGLSRVPLHHPGHDRHLFLEFIAAEHGPDDVALSMLPRVLEFVVSMCLDTREAVVRGDVIPLPEDVVRGSRFTFLYAALPVYYDADFKSLVVENGDPVAIAWLIPVTSGEAQLVAERGWSEFEQELLKHDPDLMDMNREVIA
ncbi:suppressor of fused domain protein [Micromonospora sp. NIE79]|uniref:Suppressor of fused domain protein n=1 Tax=Micromonospora trifolii TaxID=2911208 RepID=A0ABS9MTZ1_9ACTN|nr:suppressor of fused domain protein [Micromonospora trifolii]MCG5441151.1 suppressor of fused domain protein [Micromonospora trifolii]